MATNQPDDQPPERPRRRRRDDDDDRPPQKSGKTNLTLILLGVGGFFVVSTACVILGGLALMGMAMRMTPNNMPINPPNSPPVTSSESSDKPLKSNVDRDRFQREIFGKSANEVTAQLGTPSMKKTDPKDSNLEWWYYTGTNPQTGLETKVPNTLNGALVRLQFFAGRVIKVEWEPKQ